MGCKAMSILVLLVVILAGILHPAMSTAALNGISSASTAQELEFGHAQGITIGSDVVNGGPHTNFPFLFSTTSPDLAHTSHGGKVTSESGYDIIFKGLDDDICGGSGRSPCTLSHEIQYYDPTIGQLIAWVKIPSLANGETFYIYYGNSSITSSTEEATEVWDDHYIAVYHMEEATGDAKNSKSSSFHLARQYHPTQTPGKIGYAQRFSGSYDRFDGRDPVMSSILCKKQRGNLLAFRIQVKEDSIENPFHTISVTKDPHGSGPSLYFPKSSFD
jgi:hypothetical protein